MLDTVFATKHSLTQAWTEAGLRVPVTKAKFSPMTVTQIKTTDKDGYQAIQIGFGSKKREIKVDKLDDLTVGGTINPADVLQPGDTINVTGTSKGKGFTGVVKRWGFHGGPRTHGQSDRERAPGAIAQGTTPGRVFKGKKMAGHHGNTQITVRNLSIFSIDKENQEIWLQGLVPGNKNGLLTIRKL